MPVHYLDTSAVVKRYIPEIGSAWVMGLCANESVIITACPPTVRLRSLDALHLASARTAFSTAGRRGLDVGSFVSSDRALLAAAQWVNLSVANPEDFP